ncbi:kinase-like domain-containing protein [Lactarius pseudohatsudake]|nr:kinase-like domain-containing protein [Lactarius pseudohatsudake]
MMMTHAGGSKSSQQCTGSDDGENQSGPSTCPKADARGINELEACGYQVIPVIFETDGGTWELISDLKLPPHICTVYRRSDPNKTELIAKHLRDGSNELDILKHIHTIQPKSPHVISLIEAIPSITGGWLILPKLHSIRDQGFMDRRGVRGRDQLGRGLIKGLAYLHEHRIAHRDIKPDNLVCDDVFRLQIIDFDVAIEVQDENTEVDEYRGTEDWTAPEVGQEDGPTPMYSPIKADRWSCGRVLLRHMMVGKGDNRLSEFAEQLMANDPQQRPSLLEWDKWSIAPFSVAANALVDRGKEPRPRQDMVEESMKPSDAKKPRLMSDGASSSARYCDTQMS